MLIMADKQGFVTAEIIRLDLDKIDRQASLLDQAQGFEPAAVDSQAKRPG